jgi:hypothetical protein
MGLFNWLRLEPQTEAIDPVLVVAPPTVAETQSPPREPEAHTVKPGRKPRRRGKRIKVVRLCPSKPKPPKEADLQVAFVFQHIRKLSEDPRLKRLRSGWVPKPDFEDWYWKCVQHKNWEPQSWTALGIALAKITIKRRATVDGKREWHYRIPRRSPEFGAM